MSGGVSVAGVRRTFGPVVAVDQMTFTAPPGSVTALVGPNGSGKTTVMLMLASLLRPDLGQLRVAGHDPVAAPSEVRRRLGWMPDTFGSYDNLTAREVLEFFAAAHRMPRAARAARARELLALVHLEEFADAPVHVLSRGQKQRLGLARAIVHSPDVLLLDEPASGLDPRSRVDLRVLLRTLAGAGAAVLVSSHILAELEEMADRAVFVAGGHTTAEQTLTELRSADVLVPWRIRALDTDRLLTALRHYGVDFDARDASGVQVMLRGDADAAQLLTALMRDGVPVATIAPAGGALESAYLRLTEERR
ncbi:MAG TPA: ABC transporter ATP-binding protein [Sporichthyaceae bacterium]|nr:ABC transporter ATP-binding protein [Sporichthyaceae bacterium]